MLAEQRREQFEASVSELKLKAGTSGGDGKARVLGLVLMVVGVVGAFLAYNVSLSQDDVRDLASNQILATAFGALTLVGGALYVAGAVAKVLRLWLLRQLIDGQANVERLAAALEDRRV